jgi:hypothetical protein
VCIAALAVAVPAYAQAKKADKKGAAKADPKADAKAAPVAPVEQPPAKKVDLPVPPPNFEYSPRAAAIRSSAWSTAARTPTSPRARPSSARRASPACSSAS